MVRSQNRNPSPEHPKVDRGGSLRGFVKQYFRDSNFGNLITGCLIRGGRLLDGRVNRIMTITKLLFIWAKWCFSY